MHYLDYAQFDSLLPDWYRMYSLSYGPRKPLTNCPGPKEYRAGTRLKTEIKIFNCSRATTAQAERLVDALAKGLGTAERRLGRVLHVSTLKLELFDPRNGYNTHSTHPVWPSRLSFGMAVTYDADQSRPSERAIVRILAHELFHVARNLGRRNNLAGGKRIAEETRAALFGACVENDVFGSVEAPAFDEGSLMPPRWLANAPVGHGSAAGVVRAGKILADIAGNDRHLSSVQERARLNEICLTLDRQASSPPESSSAGHTPGRPSRPYGNGASPRISGAR